MLLLYARNYALEKAEERGKQTGINERNIEIAKNMLKKNSDVSFISECTGLSIEEINNIKIMG